MYKLFIRNYSLWEKVWCNDGKKVTFPSIYTFASCFFRLYFNKDMIYLISWLTLIPDWNSRLLWIGNLGQRYRILIFEPFRIARIKIECTEYLKRNNRSSFSLEKEKLFLADVRITLAYIYFASQYSNHNSITSR